MPEGDTSLHRCRTLRTFLEARSEAGSGERSEDLTWRVISIRCVFTGAFDVSGSGGGDFGSRERLSLPGLSDSAPHGHGSGQSSPWFVRRALRAHLVRYCSGGSSGGGSGERFSWALELKGGCRVPCRAFVAWFECAPLPLDSPPAVMGRQRRVPALLAWFRLPPAAAARRLQTLHCLYRQAHPVAPTAHQQWAARQH